MSLSVPAPFKDTSRLANWGRIFAQFLVGQVSITLLTNITGFVLLRWLTKSDMARYNLAFTLQTMIVSLTDAGLYSAMVGLVGENVHDPAVIGRYIKAVQWFRSRLFVITTAVSLVVIPVLCTRQHWSLWDKISITASVIATAAARGWCVYGPALVINKRMKDLYQPQGIISAIRLGGTVLLHILGQLGGHLSIWLNMIAGGAYNYIQYRKGKELVVVPAESDVETRREVIKFVAPLSFGILYSAFQGQIATLLTSYFGNTGNLADFSALTRIGALFILLTTFTWYILEPYCARIPAHLLKQRFPLLIAGMALPIGALVVLGFVWQEPFVLLVGIKYANLRPEIPLTLAGFGAGTLAASIWAMSTSRRWVFWWCTVLNVVAVVGTQIVCLKFLRMNVVHNVVLFNLFGALAALAVNVGITIYCLYFLRDGNSAANEQNVS